MNDSEKTANRFFAASNSGHGFVSYFREIFGGCRRIYVINGGPGTGKSRLIREIGQAAEAKGMECEYFLCSSDSNSLDGIIIPALETAMLDGTAPHVWDIKLPGAREQIVNLGEFWNGMKLSESIDTITALNSRKKEHYAAAYGFLSAALGVENEIMRLTEGAVLHDKLRSAAARLARHWAVGDGSEKIRLSDGITCQGLVHLPVSSMKMQKIKGEQAQNEFLNETSMQTIGCSGGNRTVPSMINHTCYTVTGPDFAVKRVMTALYEAAKALNTDRTVSFEPLNPKYVNRMYFEHSGISFAAGEDEAAVGENCINANRFIDNSMLKKHRGQLKFLEKCRTSLLDAALKRLSEAGEAHAELEGIYTEAMDFSRKAKYSAALVKKIIGQ